MTDTPAEIGRNEFDEWCWRRGLELRHVVEGLRATAERHAGERPHLLAAVPSIETVRRIRLPFTDDNRRVPGKHLAELIYLFTAETIVPAHFYPPQLRGAATSEGVAA